MDLSEHHRELPVKLHVRTSNVDHTPSVSQTERKLIVCVKMAGRTTQVIFQRAALILMSVTRSTDHQVDVDRMRFAEMGLVRIRVNVRKVLTEIQLFSALI